MAWACQSCGRGAMVGNTRSHSNIATKRRRLVNLQVKTVKGERMRMCTRCIRTIKKSKTAA